METPKSQSTSTATNPGRLAFSSAVSLLSQVTAIPILLLLTPFMIHTLGMRQYGIWAVMTLFVGYTGLAEFGLRIPLIKYVAESAARGDHQAVNRFVNTTLTSYVLLVGSVVLFLTLGLDWLIAVLFGAGIDVGQIRPLLLVMLVAFGTELSFSVLPALLSGLQRVDLAALGETFSKIIGALGTVAVLRLGWGISGLVVNYLVAALITIVFLYWLARRQYPLLRLNPLAFDWATFRKMFAFSARVQVATLAQFANTNLNRTLLAYFLSPVDVGYYQIAQRTYSVAGSLPQSLVRTLIPAASDLSASGQEERLRQLYFRSLKYIASFALPLFVGIMVLVHPFFRVWLGPDEGFQKSAWTVIIVLSSYILLNFSSSGYTILHGLGKPQYPMHQALIHLVLNISLATLLTWRMGYYGAPLSLSLATWISYSYLQVVIHRQLRVRVSETLRFSIGRPLIATAAAGAAVLFLQAAVSAENFALLVAYGLIFLAVYAAVLYVTGGLDAYDRKLFVETFLKPARHLVQRPIRLRTTDH